MADAADRRPHFVVEGFVRSEDYTHPSQGSTRAVIPPRDRALHGAKLLSDIAALKPSAGEPSADDEQPEGLDLQIEFEGFPDVELAFESLARENSGIELSNVRFDGDLAFATVFVPAGKLEMFERLIKAYLEHKTTKKGQPRDNQRLIDAIAAIRRAGLRAMWTDEGNAFPQSEDESIWWEIWLAVRGGNRAAIVGVFQESVAAAGAQVAKGELHFPERIVVQVRASVGQLQSSPMILNSIAEIRRAKETADLFDSMTVEEQVEWINELVSRTEYPPPGTDVPHVCLLDTGVTHGHPILSPAIHLADVHSVEPAWGTGDGHGHGTQMAGLALCGDLTPLLTSTEPVVLGHRIESFKLLPTDGGNVGEAHHHGYLTIEAVARPEVTAPDRSRVFGIAITARDRRDRGRPSAWSAAIDRLASDADNDGANPRLIVLAAGNIDDPAAWNGYPGTSDTDSIQDPGQAWNALTVGASTNLVTVTDAENATAVAPAGGLSPFSATSFNWERHWPLKPDVVFEGGNVASDVYGAAWTPSLSLLTTNSQPSVAMVTTARATSAAMAQGSRFAAQLMAAYPQLWPETIRGLIVQSADWTDRMRAQFLPAADATKNDYANLVRRCGFGIPDLDRALWTVSNSLTLVAQEIITPFKREAGKDVATRELHLHELPWPKETLEALVDADVEMRVTLSYFIESNPSSRGVRSRYAYQSHGLRFDVIRPTESPEMFRKRINAAAREDEEEAPDSPQDSGWTIGKQNRHRGSIHSDMWRGRAADLASRGVIAVYPSRGWWKTRQRLGRYNNQTRYSLTVSITAPQIKVDLCTEVAQQVAAIVETTTE